MQGRERERDWRQNLLERMDTVSSDAEIKGKPIIFSLLLQRI